MKTAEELLKEFRNENSYKLNLAEFTKALAEHDAEIKALIDEEIVDMEGWEAATDDIEKAFDKGCKSALKKIKAKL